MKKKIKLAAPKPMPKGKPMRRPRMPAMPPQAMLRPLSSMQAGPPPPDDGDADDQRMC